MSNEQPGPAEATQQPALPVLWVTPLLIFINIAVMGYMTLTHGLDTLMLPSSEAVLAMGANFGPLTADGELWRLATCMFVHVGLLHLAMNMFVLWNIGQAVEHFFGRTKYVVIYLIAGIAGSLNSLYWNPMNISAGASGAIFGTFGALLVYFLLQRRYFPPEVMAAQTRQIVMLIVFNLAFGASSPHIDNSAHIGGLIGGMLTGFCVVPPDPWHRAWRAADLVKMLLLVAALSAFTRFDIHHAQIVVKSENQNQHQ